MLLRGTNLRAIERQPRFGVVGVGAHGLGVLDNGKIVVVAPLRPLPVPQRRRRRARAGKQGGGDDRQGGACAGPPVSASAGGHK